MYDSEAAFPPFGGLLSVCNSVRGFDEYVDELKICHFEMSRCSGLDMQEAPAGSAAQGAILIPSCRNDG